MYTKPLLKLYQLTFCSMRFVFFFLYTGNDKSFCRKISSKNGQHPRFEKSRFGDLEFTVRHFAGDVLYSADGFLDKNRDRLQENLLTCIQTSTNNFITEILFKPKSEKKENEMKGELKIKK